MSRPPLTPLGDLISHHADQSAHFTDAPTLALMFGNRFYLTSACQLPKLTIYPRQEGWGQISGNFVALHIFCLYKKVLLLAGNIPGHSFGGVSRRNEYLRFLASKTSLPLVED